MTTPGKNSSSDVNVHVEAEYCYTSTNIKTKSLASDIVNKSLPSDVALYVPLKGSHFTWLVVLL